MSPLRDDHRRTVTMFCFVLIVLRRRFLRSKHLIVVLKCGAKRVFSVFRSWDMLPTKTPISVGNSLNFEKQTKGFRVFLIIFFLDSFPP